MKQKENFFKRKTTIVIFTIASLIGGILFLKQSTERANIIGNVIITDNYSFNSLLLIGLSLIICSIILCSYSLKKK